MSIFRSIRSGIVAGAISAFGFALVHAIFISDIWFSLPVLLAAGAICGLCLGWTYRLLFESPSLQTWLKYNALYVGMFVVIGCVSVLAFDPVTSIPALMVSSGPPEDLFKQAMPITVLSTIAMAAIISRLYARALSHFVAILFTCAVLVLLLGLNVSVIGLVSVPRSSLYLVLELAGLILVLSGAFVVVFTGLEWETLFSNTRRLHLHLGKH